MEDIEKKVVNKRWNLTQRLEFISRNFLCKNDINKIFLHKCSIFNGRSVPAMLKLWNLVQIYTSMRKSEWYYGNLNMMFCFMVMFSLKTVTYHLVCMFVISFRSKLGGYMTQKWKYFTFHFVRIWARIPIFLIMVHNSESIALGPYKIPISCFVQIKV